MIIAVLSNVYIDMISKIDADYHASLVITYNRMKDDSKYGILIFGCPPFNIISFFFWPILVILHFCLKESTIKALNQFFCMIAHIPMACFLFAIFMLF